MNWDAVGAVGEIVGALAVVMALIYLAVQVRQSTNATQAVSIQTASSLDQEFLLALGTDQDTALLWASYLATPEALSVEQRLQGAYLMASFVRRLENVCIQHRLGAFVNPEFRNYMAELSRASSDDTLRSMKSVSI